MTTKTQLGTSFSRFSRMGFGLFKSQSASPHSRDLEKVDDDESWYIPYNGPYEAPRKQSRHEKERDSWGDPVNGQEDDGDVLADPELHNRYGGLDYRAQEIRPVEAEERKGRVRARTQSSTTVSSNAIDPSRNSTGAPRRSTVSHGTRPIVPSFVDLDTSGGVGESPMPPTRYSSNPSKRKGSLASLFTFNSGKKLTPSTKGLLSAPTTPLRSSGSGDNSNPGQGHYSPFPAQRPVIHRLPSDPFAAEQSLRASGGQDDQEYYNSYYSTLIRVSSERESDLVNDGRQPLRLHSPASETSSALHPYAYRIPTPPSLEPPHSAPLFRSSSTRHGDSSAIASPSGHMRQTPHITLHPPTNTLKNSLSTPNLRSPHRPEQRSKHLFPKGKDRWLSPETWCDALLFPRPRFKVKQDSDSFHAGSGRIVSPPGSPVVSQFQDGPQIPSIASRVLVHSRSLLDLRDPPPIAGPSTLSSNNKRYAQPSNALPAADQNNSRPLRPKSWALDDLALPSPVPSLARVLEEGQILEHQRKKWQDQAIKSFQNERARSLSRARTKSLTSKQAKSLEPHSRLDFLAARGLLGNQDLIPVTQPKTRSHVNSNSQTESRGTVGRSSHTHSNSLSKSVSKSSKTHSRNHSRSESLGRSAVKIAKSTAKSTAALLGFESANVGPSPEGAAMGLEGELQNNGTRVIRLADPALMPIESASTSRNGASPTPSGFSGISDSMVGIAISTPPPQDEIRLPSHPYAQGGLSFYARNDSSVDQPKQDYAGPHPSSNLAVPGAHDLMSRYRPQAQTMSHPYAQYSPVSARNRESFTSLVADMRSDSNIPPAEKMWAQWSPTGLLREILPNELQYSPYISGSNSPVPVVEDTVVRRQMRNSSPIFDTVGVAETLVSAMQRYSRDSGLGTSEEQTIQAEPETKAVGAYSTSVEGETSSFSSSQRPHRIAVQYDASRPLYIQKHNATAPRSPSPIFESPERLHTLRNDSNDSSNSSSSPGVSSPLGNVDDLENYRDLFYRPPMVRNDSNQSTTARVPWDVNSHGHRIGSGLTSIARQLSEELEETRGTTSLHHSISLSSRSSLSALRHSVYSAGRSPPTETGLHFVFSNIPETASHEESTSVRKVVGDDSIMPFHPTIQIPEDIASSRASSPTRSPLDNDELDLFRLGHVNSLATPPAIQGENRISYTGQMSFVGEEVEAEQTRSPSTPFTGRQTVTSRSSLQPPLASADPTRSSYLTSSDASRMSNLSDFPAPPPQHLTPAHMSLLSSYFDDTLTPGELAEVKATGKLKPGNRSRSGSVLTSRPTPEPRVVLPESDVPNTGSRSRRLTFGGNEEIEDLLASLSSHS